MDAGSPRFVDVIILSSSGTTPMTRLMKSFSPGAPSPSSREAPRAAQVEFQVHREIAVKGIVVAQWTAPARALRFKHQLGDVRSAEFVKVRRMGHHAKSKTAEGKGGENIREGCSWAAF